MGGTAWPTAATAAKDMGCLQNTVWGAAGKDVEGGLGGGGGGKPAGWRLTEEVMVMKEEVMVMNDITSAMEAPAAVMMVWWMTLPFSPAVETT